MITHKVPLASLSDLFAICRLKPDAPLPTWATSGPFLSITRTAEELSIVCPQAFVPDGVKCEKGWRCLRVAGWMDLSMIGVLPSLVSPLAEAHISVFAISTFNTDYLVVKENDLEKAIATLQRAGHSITK